MSTLKLSSIESSEEELQAYYAELRSQHITPAWTGGGISFEPKSKAVPYVWHWRDLRPQAIRAAQLVGTEQAERRVLRLTNPGLPGLSASNTLLANIQIVMPGEIARAHRHSASALRFIIEGKGGYTVVNGDRIPMYPGDLVLTPNWTWHDHANDTDQPMIWLDGLDIPLLRMLEANFFEEYNEQRQRVGEGADPSVAKYGSGGLKPAWDVAPATTYSPMWHYPMSHLRIHQPGDWRAYHADDRVLYPDAAPGTAHPGTPSRLLHELSRGRGLRLLDGGRGEALVGRQGHVHGADVDLPRARQHGRPRRVPLQLH
jgi:gentisate 1,2-dioxygenase